MAEARIGLSGYSYKPWQGEDRFYPPELKQTQFLDFYCNRYNAVEMDGSWYQMPAEKSVAAWRDGSPDRELFCFKLHRKITHFARLKPEGWDSLTFMLKRLGPMALADKLGPFLVQLPPNLKRDDDRLEAFLKNLPTAIEGVSSLPRPLKWAVEFRNESWNVPEVEQIMRTYGAAWVAADTDDTKAERRDTADFHYSRLRRSEYSEESLQEWGRYFRAAIDAGKDCFIFCKHEDDGSPWIWADSLLRQLCPH